MVEDKQVIGTREAASQLGVSVRTVQLWVEKGELEAWKTPGGHRRILRSSVDDALRARSGMAPRRDRDQLCVLIVEDDATMQSYYAALFDILAPDARLVMAGDGYEGLIALGKTEPDLMLVDVDMPGMDGITMLRSLGKSKAGGDVSIAVVTGLSDKHLAERGGVPNGIPVFPKPIGVDDLRDLLAGFGRDGK